MNIVKPISVSDGLSAERVAALNSYIAKVNKQSERISKFKDELLDYLNLSRDQRQDAWCSIVMTALHYNNWKPHEPPAAHKSLDSIYKGIEELLHRLITAEGRFSFGELPDYRLAELIPVLDATVTGRPRRRHMATQSPVPDDLICELAFIFNQYTGKKPGTGEGPFANFVHFFWQVLGNNREYQTVIKDIRKVRRNRPTAFEQPAAFLRG